MNGQYDSQGSALGTPPPVAGQGLTDNVAGGLAYITIIPAIVFLVLAPYNQRPFIRFNCWQCLLCGAVQLVLGVLSLVPIVKIIAGLLSLIVFVLLVVACVMAFTGKKFVIPGIGAVAENLSGSGAPVL